jgi:isocitrate/isopropylmalate dehydrogenase
MKHIVTLIPGDGIGPEVTEHDKNALIYDPSYLDIPARMELFSFRSRSTKDARWS